MWDSFFFSFQWVLSNSGRRYVRNGCREISSFIREESDFWLDGGRACNRMAMKGFPLSGESIFHWISEKGFHWMA